MILMIMIMIIIMIIALIIIILMKVTKRLFVIKLTIITSNDKRIITKWLLESVVIYTHHAVICFTFRR